MIFLALIFAMLPTFAGATSLPLAASLDDVCSRWVADGEQVVVCENKTDHVVGLRYRGGEVIVGVYPYRTIMVPRVCFTTDPADDACDGIEQCHQLKSGTWMPVVETSRWNVFSKHTVLRPYDRRRDTGHCQVWNDTGAAIDISTIQDDKFHYSVAWCCNGVRLAISNEVLKHEICFDTQIDGHRFTSNAIRVLMTGGVFSYRAFIRTGDEHRNGPCLEPVTMQRAE